MSDITTEQMLDEVDDEIGGLECAAGMCEPGSDERDHQEGILAVFRAIRTRLTDYDTLKAEVEKANDFILELKEYLKNKDSAVRVLKAEVDELATKASHLQHDLFCEERDRNKAEAELERARPLLEAAMLEPIYERDIIRAALAYRESKEDANGK